MHYIIPNTKQIVNFLRYEYVDDHANLVSMFQHVSNSGRSSPRGEDEDEHMPELQDLPMGVVNACLYQQYEHFRINEDR